MAEAARRPSPNVVAVAALVALIAALLVWRQPWNSSSPDEVSIPANSAAQIAQQARDLSVAASAEEWARAAGSSSKAAAFADESWDARQAVGVESVAFRYITGGEVADRDDGSTEATLDVTWVGAPGSAFAGERSAQVGVRLDPQPDATLAIRSVRAISGPFPVWLAGNVSVTTADASSIIRIDGGDPSFDVERASRTARAAVASVVADVCGDLTVISPATSAQMAALVGQDAADLAQIAAVTTNLDGGSSADAVIVLNPDLYATMDARARQIVLSHEATHVLTNALGTSGDTWVVEGFADYVALFNDDAPVTVSAAQAIAAVRVDGPPAALPSSDDFSSSGRGLGAVYEVAWLIFRAIDEVASPEDVVAFYRDVVSGVPTEKALDTHVGLSIDELTRRWQDELRRLAS